MHTELNILQTRAVHSASCVDAYARASSPSSSFV